MAMKTPQRDNLKQIAYGSLSMCIGWAIVIGLVLPAMSSLLTSVAWISISPDQRKVILVVVSVILIGSGIGCVKLAMRRRVQQGTYTLLSQALIGLGPALMLAGGLLIGNTSIQQ